MPGGRSECNKDGFTSRQVDSITLTVDRQARGVKHDGCIGHSSPKSRRGCKGLEYIAAIRISNTDYGLTMKARARSERDIITAPPLAMGAAVLITRSLSWQGRMAGVGVTGVASCHR